MTGREVYALLQISRKTLYNYCHIYRGRPPVLTRIQFRAGFCSAGNWWNGSSTSARLGGFDRPKILKIMPDF
jgi:hypothetical protein